MNTRGLLDGLQPKKKVPEFRVGDTLKVHVRITEGEKERVQVFEGVVIKKHRSGAGSSFTVRKVSYGVGVERIFPVQSSAIDKIEVVHRGDVRRARLFYLRKKQGKDTVIADATRTDKVKESEKAPAPEAADTLKTASAEAQGTPVL